MENDNTNTNTNTDTGAQANGQGQGQERPTFDEILASNKDYQSEFDKRVAKALKTAADKAKADADKAKADDEKTNADAITKAVQEAIAPYKAKTKRLTVKAALTKERAKDPADIMGMLNIDELTENDDGEIDGLSEKINEIKKNKPYLFESDEQPKGKSGLPHNNDGDDDIMMKKARAAMGLK